MQRHTKFSLTELKSLYLDEFDFLGLLFWFADALDSAKQIEDATRGAG